MIFWKVIAMCGIIVCSEHYADIDGAESSVSHRGASSHKRICKDGIVFSHFLHSVVGNNIVQPFEGRGILVANCEIYNWKQLAEEHGISARNDAEMLFKLLERAKLDENSLLQLINELDGDFACVYYREGTMIAFRDPIGVNPLFYSLDPLLFASERCAAPAQLRELHPRHILVHKMAANKTKSIYNNIFSLAEHSQSSSYKSIERALLDAVDKRACEAKSGILFSGGIDSAFIALRMQEIGKRIALYTTSVGRSSSDLDASRAFADAHGFELKEINVSYDELLSHIPKICSTISSCDSVKVGVAVPIYFSAMSAARDGIKVLFSGLGSDDIFAGYHRFRGGYNIRNEQLSSLRSIYERDTYRDNTACMRNHAELRVPFLDKILVQECLRAPEKWLQDKMILRKILMHRYSLDKRFYGRPKKAAQYGSNSMKCLRKHAKNQGKTINSFLFRLHPRKNIKLGALYTGGKDSAYALYLMALRNYDISCLITVKSSNPHSFMFHTPRIDAVENHSILMSIPLVKEKSAGDKERELIDLRKAIHRAIKLYGVEGVITGALYSDYQRSRIEKICDELGIRAFSPLWHVDQETHMKRLLKDGFKFIITSVSSEGLDESWIGRVSDAQMLEDLKVLSKKYGINISGEGGEYESLVVECPLFKI